MKINIFNYIYKKLKKKKKINYFELFFSKELIINMEILKKELNFFFQKIGFTDTIKTFNEESIKKSIKIDENDYLKYLISIINRFIK